MLQLTGRTRLDGPGGTLDTADLPGRQGRLVQASLAVTDQAVTRSVLAERLWGEQPPRAWERDLSALVSKLRTLVARTTGAGPDVDLRRRRLRALAIAADAMVAQGQAGEALPVVGEISTGHPRWRSAWTTCAW